MSQKQCLIHKSVGKCDMIMLNYRLINNHKHIMHTTIHAPMLHMLIMHKHIFRFICQCVLMHLLWPKGNLAKFCNDRINASNDYVSVFGRLTL